MVCGTFRSNFLSPLSVHHVTLNLVPGFYFLLKVMLPTIVCAVVGAYIIVKYVCFELGLLPSRVSFIQALSSIKKCLLQSGICVDKSDDTRKDVLFKVLLSYAVFLLDLVISRLLQLQTMCM